ncbi:hypothetical protein TNCV_3145161 [Trichonephila clavipes]|nr:hypothetical protein TNCV_3145161 [Trichonephila clavipes]
MAISPAQGFLPRSGNKRLVEHESGITHHCKGTLHRLLQHKGRNCSNIIPLTPNCQLSVPDDIQVTVAMEGTPISTINRFPLNRV